MDGRKDYKALVLYYEGQGSSAKDINEARMFLSSKFYSAEHGPLPWVKFERDFMQAIVAKEKHYGAGTFSDRERLDVLMEKVRAPYLEATKQAIKTDIDNGNMTFDRAMQRFGSTVSENIQNTIIFTS